MSIKLMNAVLDDDTITDPTETLLLLALADHANDEGVCWPSIDRLAQRARVSERQAQRLIGKLIDDGRLEADRRGGRGRATYYKLTITKGDMSVTVSRSKGDTHVTVTRGERVTSATERVTPVTERVTSTTQKGDTHVTPTTNEPPMNHQLEPPIVGGVGEGAEESFQNGGEGETADAAQAPDAAAVELPAEVLDAWDAVRWPLTEKLCKFLINAERTFSRGELLCAIEIMNDCPRQIDRPAAYLKRVMNRRMSAIVDRAPVTAERWREISEETAEHRQPLPLRVATPPPDPAAAAVLTCLAEALPAFDVHDWRVAVVGDLVTVYTNRADRLNNETIRTRYEGIVSRELKRQVTLAFQAN